MNYLNVWGERIKKQRTLILDTGTKEVLCSCDTYEHGKNLRLHTHEVTTIQGAKIERRFKNLTNIQWSVCSSVRKKKKSQSHLVTGFKSR